MAEFHYLSPLEEYRTVKPFHINIPGGGIPGGVQTNEISQPYRNVAVHDIRGSESLFSLDRQGFTIARMGSKEMAEDILHAVRADEYRDSKLVLGRLGPKMESFIKHRLQAETVLTFAFRVRSGTAIKTLEIRLTLLRDVIAPSA